MGGEGLMGGPKKNSCREKLNYPAPLLEIKEGGSGGAGMSEAARAKRRSFTHQQSEVVSQQTAPVVSLWPRLFHSIKPRDFCLFIHLGFSYPHFFSISQ